MCLVVHDELQIKQGYRREYSYIEAPKGGDTTLQTIRIREIFDDFEADYFVVDARNSGSQIVINLGKVLFDEERQIDYSPMKAMNNDTKTAEIVKFPGFRNEASKEENLKDAQSTESSAEEIDFIAGFSDKLRQFEKEENKPWYKYGKAAGIAVLAAIGILAGSMASQADSAKFVSSVQHIINSEDVMP